MEVKRLKIWQDTDPKDDDYKQDEDHGDMIIKGKSG